ncbi:hypothetical protein [Catenulispora subtropica]|uniref:Uncharacterized protein n=1 Tax=Catenulispora subtropica TaxID=450798 RepID=A0ABP5CII8_9ACTN
MTALRAVVELGWTENEDAPWPVEPLGEYRWGPLDSTTTAAVIGTVMAATADWCRPDDSDYDSVPTAAEALRWIADSDYLVICAGVQASDGTTTVNPGCCCELNDWHGWADPRRRSAMWLGHSPEPWIEDTEAGLMVHQDKRPEGEARQSPVLITTAELPQLLADLRTDLLGFLAAVERWAVGLTGDPRLAAAVVANIDHHLGLHP